MVDSGSTEPAIDAAAGTIGQPLTKSFSLLANETRLAVLLALWEEFDPHSEQPVSYTRLYNRVDCHDGGNFIYHLEKLKGQFIRKHPDHGGYEILDPGLNIVRAIIAGIRARDETFEPTEIEQSCLLCDAPMAVGYRDRHVYWECTECSGIVPEGTDGEGLLGAVKFEPAGVIDRSPEEIKAASRVAIMHHEGSLFDGLCPTCSGPVEGWLDPCVDHQSDGVCEHCGNRFSTRARFQCRICKDHATTSPMSLALSHSGSRRAIPHPV